MKRAKDNFKAKQKTRVESKVTMVAFREDVGEYSSLFLSLGTTYTSSKFDYNIIVKPND